MIENVTNIKSKEPLPIPVIMAATSGDAEAVRAVLKHYEGYILALSMKRLHDDDGNAYFFVDEDMCRELETRLITKVLMFRPKPEAA
jgi:hypothetical protein